MSMKNVPVGMAKLKFVIPGFVVVLLCAIAVAGTSIDSAPLEGLVRIEVEGTGSGSTNASSGVARGNPVGIVTYTTAFTNSPDSLSNNGIGGQCIRGGGTVVLTTANGTVLSLEQVGLNCNASSSAAGDATVNGTFVINPTLSTGRFAGATGTGTVVTGQYGGSGQTFLTIDGAIKLNQ